MRGYWWFARALSPLWVVDYAGPFGAHFGGHLILGSEDHPNGSLYGTGPTSMVSEVSFTLHTGSEPYGTSAASCCPFTLFAPVWVVSLSIASSLKSQIN